MKLRQAFSPRLWIRMALGFLVVFMIVAGILLVLDNFLTPQCPDCIPNYLDGVRRPLILCHRGSRYMGPESTIHIFKWALRMGCDVLELDVRSTLDDRLVVIHDEKVDRITNGTGYVRNLNYDQDIQWLDSGYYYSPFAFENGTEYYPFRGKGHRICLLEEVMKTFPDTFKNIEIKENSAHTAWLLWQEIKKYPQAFDKIIVTSGFCDCLNYFREISRSSIATGACEVEVITSLITHKLGVYNVWNYFLKPKATVYQIPLNSSGVELGTESLIRRLKGSCQKVIYWVINNEEKTQKIIGMNADGVVTDRTDIIYNAYYKMGIFDVPHSEFVKEYQSVINTTESYYVPLRHPEEGHTCLTLSCKMIPFMIRHGVEFFVFFVCLVIVSFVRVERLLGMVEESSPKMRVFIPKKGAIYKEE